MLSTVYVLGNIRLTECLTHLITYELALVETVFIEHLETVIFCASIKLPMSQWSIKYGYSPLIIFN